MSRRAIWRAVVEDVTTLTEDEAFLERIDTLKALFERKES